MKYLVFVTLLICSFSGIAQTQKKTVKTEKANTWDKWQWLIGDWKTMEESRDNQASGTFSFKPDLDQKVLVRRGHAEYNQLRTDPMIHNDLMVIYPGYSGTPAKAVYFDNEGHSINYTFNVTDKSIVFTSERTNFAPVFRMGYNKIDSNVVNAKFETSQDGTTFQTYMEGKCKRVKPGAN